MASDPAYNLAAELLAANLNVAAGAGSCPAAVQAINDAQSLLAAVHFNDTGSYGSAMSGGQTTEANTLTTLLDSYNNNNFGFCVMEIYPIAGITDVKPFVPAQESRSRLLFTTREAWIAPRLRAPIADLEHHRRPLVRVLSSHKKGPQTADTTGLPDA